MNVTATSLSLELTETATFISVEDNTACVEQDNNPIRTVGITVSSLAVLENSILVIAMITYWPKFYSNLYRFVASLICADLLVAIFTISTHILKFYDSSSEAIAFVKGAFVTMHMISTFSVSLVNMSVFFTYSRFATRLLEQQNASAEDVSTSRVRHYFRKPAVAYILIVGVWAIGSAFMVLSVVSRCKAIPDGCLESCSTVAKRWSDSEEFSPCTSKYCSKFLAPLSSFYTLSVIIMFWVSFVFLIGSTFTVVCVKVSVKLSNKAMSDNNGFVSGDEDRLPAPGDSESRKLSRAQEAKMTAVCGNALPVLELSQGNAYKRKRSIHYVITERIGFNKDLMSRFSLLVTVVQCIFWIPVTAIILYTMVSDKTFTSFRTYEIMQIYFALPTIVNPWICVMTMSKLRDALFNAYRSLCY